VFHCKMMSRYRPNLGEWKLRGEKWVWVCACTAVRDENVQGSGDASGQEEE